jgi:hypothetical protein
MEAIVNRKLIFIALMINIFPLNVFGDAKKERPTRAGEKNCASCHVDFASVFPENHTPVKGKNIAPCLTCHKPGRSSKPEKNVFSSILHRAHQANRVNLDCEACHTWTPGKRFGLANSSINLGKPSRADMAAVRPIFRSWASSPFIDATHAKANVMCAACHGKDFPEEGDSVEKERCLSCHGSYRDLAAKTNPSDFPDRNPHRSHLGEVECSVCHKAHSASIVYCVTCHPGFKMKITGEKDAR